MQCSHNKYHIFEIFSTWVYIFHVQNLGNQHRNSPRSSKQIILIFSWTLLSCSSHQLNRFYVPTSFFLRLFIVCKSMTAEVMPRTITQCFGCQQAQIILMACFVKAMMKMLSLNFVLVPKCQMFCCSDAAVNFRGNFFH